jgi:hypothetical protein
MEKSKRGRRPKVPVNVTKIENLNSDTPIIAHLPIDLSEVINEQVDEIFIKPENNYYDNHNDIELKMLRKKIDELNTRLAKYEKNIKPSIIICMEIQNVGGNLILLIHLQLKCQKVISMVNLIALENFVLGNA